MEIDCRGLKCPMPVIQARQALEQMEAGTLTVLVSAEVQAQNVRRAVESGGHEAEIEAAGDHFRVVATKSAAACEACAPEPAAGVTWLLTAEQLGPEPTLGALLMKMLCYTLGERSEKPVAVVLLNEGVRLACLGSQAADSLAALERAGTRLLVCGTCLEYLGLLEEERVGTVSNMYEIADALCAAERVVSL